MTDCSKVMEVDENTACAVYQWLREVCSTQLLGMTIELGGQGQIVQIDEEAKALMTSGMCSAERLYSVPSVLPTYGS